MRQLKLRFAVPEDKDQLLEWLHATPNNDFDPNILTYPTLRTMCSYNGAGPVAFLPTHKAMILESTALAPSISEIDSAQALRDLVKAAQLMASAEGMKELYFIVSDEAIAKVAADHGFEEKRVMRLKL